MTAPGQLQSPINKPKTPPYKIAGIVLLVIAAIVVGSPSPLQGSMNDTPESPADAGLTHFDAQGQAHMVDVGGKPETRRVARAAGTIRMQPATLAAIAQNLRALKNRRPARS